MCACGLAAAQEITFRSTTQLVVVHVSAKDRNGNPVEGLTADDFKVFEDGKPQRIEVFEFQRLDGGLDLPPREVSSAPGAPAGQPGEVRYKDRRLLALFLDQSSMPPADFWRAQDAALKFVREQMAPRDLVAVIAFAKKLEVLQEFTDDRDQLEKVIGALTAGLEEDAPDDEEEAEFTIFNTDRRLAALEEAVRLLGSLAERKALVYFAAGSGGGTGMENQSQLRATINAAARANVTFYPVDARGLTAQAPAGNASVASAGGVGLFSGQAILQAEQQLGGEDETLYRLAKETGGKALVNTNDLTLGLREAQKDLSSYYILGYYSPNAEPDGKFRRIRVETSRKLAGLDYRKGYFAPKVFGQFTAADRERQLEEALLLGDPITDLGVALEVGYFRTERNRYFVPVAVKIPGSAIPFPEGGGSSRLDFIAQVKDATGRVAAVARDDVEIKLGAEAAAGLARRPVHYDTAFLLPPGPYTLKVVTRENLTGKMGTFETGFFVPDLATELDYLPISSVVLSNHRETVNGKPAPHPLIHDGQKLIPSVTRVFRQDQRMYVYLEKYHAAGATVRIGLYRGKQKAFESDPIELAGAAASLTVPLETLQPGRYTCQVSVLAPAARKFAFWRTPIVVIP
ncbi:MAG: VWA domain-containing protein [Bryobacteraceae bacterium]|nr:VWA domain-containing protein [Bryobacteraceae bacterium]